MAALRHAERQGAGDVVFVSSDGYVLEGPRSTVVIATESEDGARRPYLLTPPPWYPILRGTTQQALFEVARNKGYDCDYRALRPADLLAAQGVWLISSITLAARVHTLDGKPLRPAPIAAELSELVDAAIISDRCLRFNRPISACRCPARPEARDRVRYIGCRVPSSRGRSSQLSALN
jgi:4-amino-4-deoxychorismate lyase